MTTNSNITFAVQNYQAAATTLPKDITAIPPAESVNTPSSSTEAPTTASTSSSSASEPPPVYSALAQASAPTIRGSSVNIQA